MTGGWSYIIAAYVAAAVLLGGYSLSIVTRVRREREAAREREVRIAAMARHGPEGESPRT